VNDGYQSSLAEHEVAALELTDALIGMPGPLPVALQEKLKTLYSDADLVELSLGVGLFLGMSKVLISLGLEPQEMPTTVIPTPGS
jgi:hypothetical protein